MPAENNQFDLAKWAHVDSEWNLAETAVANLDRVILHGPSGVGKSYLASRAGPALSITLCEDISVQEVGGHYLPSGAQWSFHYGPVSTAFKEGRRLVINEMGRASGAVHDFMLAVLDGRDVARITLPSGETIQPGAGFKVIATSNSSPDTLDPALRSRFQAEVFLPSPHPSLVRKFEQLHPGLGRAFADSFKDPDRAIDPRRLLSFVELLEKSATLRVAAALTFVNSAPDVLAAFSAAGVRFPCDRS